LQIATELLDGFAPAERAWFVKSAIQGFALGCLPAFKRWGLPPLYESGVRFQLPPEHGSGLEFMRLPLYTYRDGWGDCDRLLIWWLCEQWARGRAASCSTYFMGGNMHVCGRRSWDDTGPLEDPSTVLGARVPAGWPSRVPLIRSFP
jgi:hypothetical protein